MTSVDTWSTSADPTCSATSFFISLIFSIINRSQKESLEADKNRGPSENNVYDFIVVGAGSAGAVVANRLSEHPDWRVLILEAGGEQPKESNIPAILFGLQGTDLNWNYRAEPEKGACNGTGCLVPRGKVLGGCSVLNGMLYVRGNPADFDNWSKRGNPGWSYDDLLPLFKKSESNNDEKISSNEKYHGKDGYLHVEYPPHIDENARIILKALTESGLPENLDINGESQMGATILQTTTSKGQRWGTNAAFLQSVKDRENLDIVTNAHVTKVLIDENTKTAIGVEYLDANNVKQTARALKEVIVSGGTVNSPQILMLSGIGPGKHLHEMGIKVMKDLPGVGKNYHDHPSGEGIYFKLDKTSTDPKKIEKTIEDQIAYESFPVRQGPLTSVGPLLTTAFIRTKYQPKDDPRPDLQLHFIGIIKRDAPADHKCNPFGDLLFSYYDTVAAFPVALSPKSRGEILLRSADPLDHPLIYQRMFTDEYDMKILLEGANFLAKLENTKAFKKHNITLQTAKMPGCEGHELGTNQYWECAIRTISWTIFHPVGTCKMGPSTDPEAVVDSKLKVYGIKGLRVADASIMPQVTSGNTNAPSIVIGEKVSYLIKKVWLAG